MGSIHFNEIDTYILYRLKGWLYTFLSNRQVSF
jgi:hypothetical protein